MIAGDWPPYAERAAALRRLRACGWFEAGRSRPYPEKRQDVETWADMSEARKDLPPLWLRSLDVGRGAVWLDKSRPYQPWRYRVRTADGVHVGREASLSAAVSMVETYARQERIHERVAELARAVAS